MDIKIFLWTFHVLIYILLLSNLCTCKIGELLINSNISEYSGLVGVDFNLTCKYYANTVKGCDVRGLFFADADQKPLKPYENTEILNDSTIFYPIKNPSMMKGNYYCKCFIDGAPQIIDLISVKIGTKPQKIRDEDFQCMSHQLKYFECSFKEPYNPVTTEYNATYKLGQLYRKRAENGTIYYKKLSQNQLYICKLLYDGQKYTCNITQHDDITRYIASMNDYKFTLSASNKFGSYSQDIHIKHSDLIVPSKPDLVVTNITPNSVTFKWQKGVFSIYDLTCNLRYNYLNDRKINEEDFISYPITACDNKYQISEIKLELPYAYTKYDVRFSFKIRNSANDTKWWSESYKTLILSKPRGPDKPPRTDMGSFFIDQKNVHLFWVKLPKHEENGPNLSYIINIRENDINVDYLKPQKIDSYTAVFEKQSFLYSGLKKDKIYEFQIKSRNNISDSEQYSIIRIPPMNAIKEEHMTELKKLRSGDHYILSWKSPKNIDNLINYTIFWCKTKQESLTECDGSIDFTYVDYVNATQGEQNFTMIQNLDVLNFAISANYKDFSYGMSWAACTAALDAELPPMVIQIKDQKSDSFVIHWNLECVHKSVLKGYNLTYCETDNNYKCIHNETTMLNIPITKKYEYKLKNLKPYTNYLVKMAMYSEKNKGMMSQAATTTTLEAAPSEPRHLKLIKITSSYAIISWEPPLHENGVIRSYTIHYGASAKKISNQEFTEKFELKENIITYRLDGLQNNHAYKVYVEAETVGITKSNSIYFNTWIGKPDAIQKVIRDPKSLSSHAYAWKEPSQSDGETSFYVVRVTVNNNDNIISYVTSNSCTLNLNLIDSCNGVSNYRLAVSAVNAIPKEKFDFEAFRNVDLDTNRYENKCNSNFLNNRRKRTTNHLNDKPNEVLCINPQSFQCLENIDMDRLNLNYSNSYFAQNELQDSDSFTCFHPKESNSKQPLLIILGIIFSIVIMVAITAIGVKKVEKMKNIDFVLPPGLDDLNQDHPAQLQHNGNTDLGGNESLGSDEIIISSTPIGFETTLMPHQINKKYQSSECLLPNSHDSGFPTGNEFLSDKNNGYVLHDGFGSVEAPILDENCSTRSSSESVELSDICNSDSPTPVCNNVKRQNDTNTNSIKPNMVINPLASPIIVNGYIQQSALQKSPPMMGIQQNGYTTLEALGKPTVSQNPTKLPINPSSNYIDTTNLQQLKQSHQNPIGIGGYVTHKQLSEFGQQRLQ